jgi:hypothetical protein
MVLGSLLNSSRCSQEFTNVRRLQMEVRWNTLWFIEECESDSVLRKITSRKSKSELDSILINRIRWELRIVEVPCMLKGVTAK